MVSIVLVSHSRKLAQGLLDLLRQVTPPGVHVAEAAGVGEGHAEIGTDALYIAEVIQAVYSPDGVLVLVDLGSAVLNAEMALELLPEEMRAQVCICPAPFVEGALAAGVQAGLGSDLQAVCRESQQALAAKIEQLAPQSAPPEAAQAAAGIPGGESFSLTVTVRAAHGLHLRPAAQFVQAAARFAGEVRVWNLSAGRGPALASSINALAMLNARQGDEIQIEASGPGAEAVVRALGELAGQDFGEKFEEAAREQDTAVQNEDTGLRLPGEQAPASGGWLRGIPVSGGVAVALLYRLRRESIQAPGGPAEDPVREWEKLGQALRRVKASLEQRREALRRRAGDQEAAIFDAHRLLLEDPELLENSRRRIIEDGWGAAAAWLAETGQLQERYRALEDSYLSKRAADVADVGGQVLAALAGKPVAIVIHSAGPVILYADDLAPSETAALDLELVIGLATARGGAASHSAILARALGIPAVSGIDLPGGIPDGTLIALDGGRGLVYIDPPAEIRAAVAARRREGSAEREALLAAAREPAVLKSGRRIAVMANIGGLAEASLAVEQGAEGVGLLRTEFLFLSRAGPPGEDEQAAALLEIGRVMGGRPVTVRTLDVGGDKDLPYLALPEEANPFLGVRAVRLSLRRPDLFQAQLRAVLRAADEHPMRVMFPMIATFEDLTQALDQLTAAHAALSAEGSPHRWPIETGIMVETPSAALLSDRFAPLVDFFSIGTNDLTQYTLAADRGNPALAEYGDALHPAVLSLIQQVVQSAKRHGKQVGMCGELAGDPLAAPVLVGLGLEELSLNPTGIPRMKAALRGLEEGPAVHLAKRALLMDGAVSVRAAARETLRAAR